MVSNMIVKCNGNNKVIDFRDKLHCPSPDEYAMMHQMGGMKNKGTYPSTIEMVVCDFSQGTGDKSVTVSVNLDPTIIPEWYEVCKRNIGTAVVPTRMAVPKEGGKPWEHDMADNDVNVLKKHIEQTHQTAKAVAGIISKSVGIIANAVTGKAPVGSSDMLSALGKTFKDAKEVWKEPVGAAVAIRYPDRLDYHYELQKVNVHKKQADGFAPVTLLSVTHESVRQDGDLSNYPWTIKITNGEAPTSEKNTGAVTFNGKAIRNKTEAFIQVSDRDMFRMMHRVSRFIETWENAMCIPTILEGVSKVEKERQEYLAKVKEGV